MPDGYKVFIDHVTTNDGPPGLEPSLQEPLGRMHSHSTATKLGPCTPFCMPKSQELAKHAWFARHS